ncbi:Diguanylate cyclase/phosphodiesterase [Yersinia bercovieri ATCC 43970]|uniref:Diguanylate cyclase/phosphodiesterase n=1 Tax=Yersinia bercovieri ATCC 43970 TaxID=349968 RepID=A0ABM9Y068_YERBE|nr:Diguanylate cyclase/phosphodiesterase [Yersinia bercovieri ATCC 43970]
MQIVTSATTATAAICFIVNERLTRKLALRQCRLNKKSGCHIMGLPVDSV